MKIAFLACVEPGVLEAQALLLFRSIRKYAGQYADSGLYSFQPREGPALTDTTLRGFDELGVRHSTERLNTDFAHYPIGNKIFASAHAEEVLTEDVLVFVDSDTFFAREPTELALPEPYDAGIRPVDSQNRGSTGPGDPHDEYWLRLYEICGVPEGPYVETSVDRLRIRAYWNAGLIAARRSAGLYGLWKRNFLALMAANHIPPNGKLNNLDQLSLAAAFATRPERIRVLDERYNYPLPKRADLPSPQRETPLEELVHVHYHRHFNRQDDLSSVDPPFDPRGEIFQWVSSHFPLLPRGAKARRS